MARLGDLLIDSIISCTPSRRIDPTVHPIGRGSSAGDHAIVRPLMFDVEMVVSNSPIEDALILDRDGIADPSIFAWEYLDLQQTERNLLEFDSDGLFPLQQDMMVVSVSAPKNVGTAKALMVSVTLQQFVQVDIDTANVTTTITLRRAKGKKNKGATSGETPAQEAEAVKESVKGKKNESWANMLIGDGLDSFIEASGAGQ